MPLVGQNPIREFLPAQFWERWFDFFVYSLEFNPLVASAAAQQDTFTVDNDSDFLVLSIACVETQTPAFATEIPFPPVLLRLQDSGSGATWQDQPQQIVNICGKMSVNGFGPGVLEVPRWVPAASTVTGEATNLEATDRRLWIAFRGCKIYRSMRRNYGA